MLQKNKRQKYAQNKVPPFSEAGILISQIDEDWLLQHKPYNYPSTIVSVTSEFWNRSDAKAVLTCVISRLDILSLSICACVSKLWHSIANNPFVWRSLFDNYFGGISLQKTIDLDWKQEFIQQYNTAKQVGIYFSHRKGSQFIPPVLCYTNTLEVLVVTTWVYGDTILSLGRRRLTASSLMTSEKLWSTSVSFADDQFNKIQLDDNTVYVNNATTGTIEAFWLSTGMGLWMNQTKDFRQISLYHDNLLAMDRDGKPMVLNKFTGNILFELETEHTCPDTQIFVSSELLYCMRFKSFNCSLLEIFNLKTKSVMLVVDLTTILQTNIFTVDSWHISGNLLFINTWEKMFAIQFDTEKHTASKLWEASTDSDSQCFTGLICHRGILWTIFATDVVFFGFDSKSGEKLFQVPIGGVSRENEMIVYILDDILYYGFVDSNVNAFCFGAIDALRGKVLWQQNMKASRGVYNFPAWHRHIKNIFAIENNSLVFLWHP